MLGTKPKHPGGRRPAGPGGLERIVKSALAQATPEPARFTSPIVSTEAEQRLVYCVAIEPDVADLDDEAMDAPAIEETAHRFMTHSRVVKSQHKDIKNAVVVESYIAPQDLQFNHPNHEAQEVKKGSWVIGIRIDDPAEWAKVRSGDYTGVSIMGYGIRRPA